MSTPIQIPSTESAATPHRRAVLAGVLTLAGAAGPGSADASPSPDAELLDLCRQLAEAWRAERGIDRDLPDDEYEALFGAAHDRCWDIVEQIEATEARTALGIVVKAVAAAWGFAGGVEDVVLMGGILRDAIAIGLVPADIAAGEGAAELIALTNYGAEGSA